MVPSNQKKRHWVSREITSDGWKLFSLRILKLFYLICPQSLQQLDILCSCYYSNFKCRSELYRLEDAIQLPKKCKIILTNQERDNVLGQSDVIDIRFMNTDGEVDDCANNITFVLISIIKYHSIQTNKTKSVFHKTVLQMIRVRKWKPIRISNEITPHDRL